MIRRRTGGDGRTRDAEDQVPLPLVRERRPALDRAVRHATDFLQARLRQLRALRRSMDRPPLIVSPYDAELFGHWWFEGPDWLEQVIRQAGEHPRSIRLVSLSDYLQEFPEHQAQAPSLSSWGTGGFSDVWLSGANDWVYRHLHAMSRTLVARSRAEEPQDAIARRALTQMARELLLAQSSDWTFILKNQTHATYAYRRLHDHLARFAALEEGLEKGGLDPAWLTDIETKDNLFPFLNHRTFAAP